MIKKPKLPCPLPIPRLFSLVELLVVILILSVLLSLLLPALNSARAKARDVVCKNKQKQIHLAFMMHAQDNNGILHQVKRTNSAWWFSDFTNGAKDPYLGAVHNLSNPYYTERNIPEILVCPDDDYGKQYMEAGGGGWQARYHHPVSYGINEKAVSQTSANPQWNRLLRDIPPERLMIYDKCTSGKGQNGWTKDVADRTSLFRTYYDQTNWFSEGNGANRHKAGGSVNGTNFDGSVFSINFIEFVLPDRGYEGWDMEW